MKWGVIKILGIVALVGINLSLWGFSRQPDKQTALETPPLLNAKIISPSLPAVNPDLEKKKPTKIRGTFLFRQNQDFPDGGVKLGQIPRINTPLIYQQKGNRFASPGKFSIELYQFTEKPNTHFHIRAVDHNDIGYGGGLKIALEIVEKF